MIPRILVAASAAIVLVLGFLHLAYTFFTGKLNPRDEELEKGYAAGIAAAHPADHDVERVDRFQHHP